MRFFCAIGEESQVDNKCIVYLRIMINPRCAALLRELFCGNFAGLSGIRTLFPTEVRFVINWKTNNCKLIIIIAKSVIHLFYLWAFFNPLEDLPGYPIPVPGNAGNCILESNFTSFPGGGMLPDLPKSWCIRHKTFAPTARTMHVRQLKHCIRYFQMQSKSMIFHA